MSKTLEGQMNFNDLDKIYRKKCKLTGKDNCNIFYAHDVAVAIGVNCEYGCCYSCKHNKSCGASCNTARQILFDKY